MTYTVWTFDDAVCEDVMVFSGSLAECQAYIADCDCEFWGEEFYIVEPDGFTVWGNNPQALGRLVSKRNEPIWQYTQSPQLFLMKVCAYCPYAFFPKMLDICAPLCYTIITERT